MGMKDGECLSRVSMGNNAKWCYNVFSALRGNYGILSGYIIILLQLSIAEYIVVECDAGLCGAVPCGVM